MVQCTSHMHVMPCVQLEYFRSHLYIMHYPMHVHNSSMTTPFVLCTISECHLEFVHTWNGGVSCLIVLPIMHMRASSWCSFGGIRNGKKSCGILFILQTSWFSFPTERHLMNEFKWLVAIFSRSKGIKAQQRNDVPKMIGDKASDYDKTSGT